MGEEWRTRVRADGGGVENESESWWERSGERQRELMGEEGERERELMGEEWRTRAYNKSKSRRSIFDKWTTGLPVQLHTRPRFSL